MTAIHRYWRLVHHFWVLWRSGQIRFRLETFGVYYPSPPYEARWWVPSPRVLWLLAVRIRMYASWLEEMDMIGRKGGKAWWTVHPSARRSELP